MEKIMNLDTIFKEVLITEMARADLKGAGNALIGKDWAKAAKIYVKNTRERGMEDAKIVSGLGATFRPKKGESTVTVGKTEDNKAITLTTDDVAAMKKAVKSFMGFETKSSKKSKTATQRAAKQSDKESTALKAAMGKSELLKKESKKKKSGKKLNLLGQEMEEGTKNKAVDEIFRNVRYADYYLRTEKKKISKTDAIMKEALKDRDFKDAIKDILENKTQKQINQLLEK